MMPRVRAVAVLLLLSVSKPATGDKYQYVSCVNVLTHDLPHCTNVGCEVRDVGKSTGFCCTAAGCFTEKLKPNEQVCCTGEKLIKMQLGPNQRLVCGQRRFWVLDEVKAEDDACCISESYKDDDWKQVQGITPEIAKRLEFVRGKPCVILRSRNLFKNERLGCTAYRVMFAELGPDYNSMACSSTDCFKRLLQESEGLGCHRFRNLRGSFERCGKREKAVCNLPG